MQRSGARFSPALWRQALGEWAANRGRIVGAPSAR